MTMHTQPKRFLHCNIQKIHISKDASGTLISGAQGPFLPGLIEATISLYHLRISGVNVVQVILSSISAICSCTLIGAIADFSNSSGESTLEYIIICQCKQPSCCGPITPLNVAMR